MHPPPFQLQDRLSDWPDCILEPHCGCTVARVTLPIRLLIEQRGDCTFAALLSRLACRRCKARPAPVYLVAGHHRTFNHAGLPDWSLELVPPRAPVTP